MAVVTCRSCGRCNLAEELNARGFRCELCGEIIPPSERPPESACSAGAPVGLTEQEVRLQQRRQSPVSFWDVFDWYRAVKWVGGSLFCIVIGIWLIASPTFRTNPKELTVSDAMPGVAAIVVGWGMLALLVSGMFRR